MTLHHAHRAGRQRRLLSLLALATVASSSAWSQTATRPEAFKAVGIFSLLGDSVQVAMSTDAPQDTRIERTARYAFDAKGIGFDNIALRQLRSALQASSPKAEVEFYKATTPLTPDEQRAIADGALKAELPDWIVHTINAKRLSHIVLVTRLRGDVNIQTANGYAIGRGSATGIGYYVDTLYEVRNTTTGELSTGALAPYVHVKLTLMDAQSGDVLRTYSIREGRLLAVEQGNVSVDPWTYLTGQEKVAILRDEFENRMERAARELLKP